MQNFFVSAFSSSSESEESPAARPTLRPEEISASHESSAPPDLKTIDGETDPAKKENEENHSSKKKSDFPIGIVAGAVGGALALISLAVFAFTRRRSLAKRRLAVADSSPGQGEAMRNLGESLPHLFQ